MLLKIRTVQLNLPHMRENISYRRCRGARLAILEVSASNLPIRRANMDGFKVSYARNQRDTNIKLWKEYFTRIQLPFWLARTTWDVHARQACNGWRIILRSRTVRPFGDDLLRIIEKGSSVELFRKLMRSSQGINDCDEYGNTLLHVRVPLHATTSTMLMFSSTRSSLIDVT